MVPVADQETIAAAQAAAPRVAADRAMPVPAGRTARVGQEDRVAVARVMADKVPDAVVALVGKADSRPLREWLRMR
jgi:ABC-type sugar transport system substrate-binding protein